MIKLNMLPDVKRDYLRTRQTEMKVISGAVLFSIIAVGLTVLLALFTYGVQTLQKNVLTSTINKNMSQLQSIKDIDKYVTIQNQLSNISSLHDKKGLYSRLFTILPNLNPKAPNSVTLSALDLDAATTTLVFTGETNSFTALETFRDTLKNASLIYATKGSQATTTEPLFSTVTVDTQALGKRADGSMGVSFKITTIYNLKTFAKDSTDISVSVPNKETTQSKQDAPDVFGPKTIQNGESQ